MYISNYVLQMKLEINISCMTFDNEHSSSKGFINGLKANYVIL